MKTGYRGADHPEERGGGGERKEEAELRAEFRPIAMRVIVVHGAE